jgi:hypothetical protein
MDSTHFQVSHAHITVLLPLLRQAQRSAAPPYRYPLVHHQSTLLVFESAAVLRRFNDLVWRD